MGALSSLPIASSASTTHPAGASSGLAGWLPPAVGRQAPPPPHLPLTSPPSEALSSPLPGEQQLRDAAAEVQTLLVRGKKGDAFKVRRRTRSLTGTAEYEAWMVYISLMVDGGGLCQT